MNSRAVRDESASGEAVISEAVNSGYRNEFTLTGFTGAGYDRGRGLPMQVLWMVVSRTVLFRWWFPVRLRIAVLRGFGAVIGDDVVLRHGVRIHWPWKLTVGDGTWIGEETWILNLEPVTIGTNTCISQGVLLCTGSHDRHSPTFEFDNAPIIVGDRVWLAARSTVLRGVRVGDGATIGATALVTRDVEPGTVVLAPPAAPHAPVGPDGNRPAPAQVSV